VRRKTRRKFSWFPTIGTAVGPQDSDNLSGRAFGVTVPANGSTDVIIAPVIPDVPMEGDDIDVTLPGQLVQAVGQEYLLERIVGKAFCALRARRNAGNDPSTWAGALLGIGFFVARANDADAGGGADTPIGSASPAERQENYSPLSEDAIREPWIWRRVWALGNRAFADVAAASQIVNFNTVNDTVPEALYPYSTAGYGSMSDGPHIDAKSVRRIGNDERLWFAVAAAGMPSVGGQTETVNSQGLITGYLDLRVLGRLTRARGKSAF